MNSNILNVLIVDDEIELRRSVISILQSSLPNTQFQVDEADNGRTALENVKSNNYHIVLMDVRMPEMDGLEALEQIKAFDSRIFVVIMTAHSNLQDAVKAIKHGAYDYLEKPLQPEKLTEILGKVLETRDIVQELALSNPIFDDDIDSELVGRSEKMRGVYDLIYKLSHVDTTVLIRGENGTGKELVARAIHSNSPRKHGDFIAINCGAIPENLMESEIFGHEKGAFTGAVSRKIGKFQQANDGTIFLDEIGELKPELQVKLLRVLQERKFIPVGGHREIKTNARVIAATNRNLEAMIENGEFREDLFYRLNVMPIFLPPLRDRIDDVKDLANFFIKKFNLKLNKSIHGLDSSVEERLKAYHWPGNIRELENTIERAFIIETSDMITTNSLPDNVKASDETHINLSQTGEYSGPLDFDKFKEESEKEFIIKALRTNNGKINKTVAHANIPKNTLLRKIKKYGINVKDFAEN
ncbi:MAG: sigma-54 dependent transcriptional regulator [Bdellovibrionales bacterium]